MTAGHFGFAAGMKSQAPRVPLWALMVGTYLLDIIFIVLAAGGVEGFAPLDPLHPAYGQVIIHAYYSHSLVSAILLAVVTGWLARRPWGKRGGFVVCCVVFSHWILDLIVHRPDLPILPGDLGNLPLLGLGLWKLPIASALVELGLAIGGAYFYYRAALRAPAITEGGKGGKSRALIAAGSTGALTVLLLASDTMGFSLSIALLLMLALIVFCGWLDSRLKWSKNALPASATAVR